MGGVAVGDGKKGNGSEAANVRKKMASWAANELEDGVAIHLPKATQGAPIR